MHVVTHSKDIDLSEIYGDTYVEDSNGTISMEPAGAYGVEAKNDKGDMELTLPPECLGHGGWAHAQRRHRDRLRADGERR